MTHRPGLSDAERDVLRVLWDHGPATVRQINQVLVHRGRAGLTPLWRHSCSVSLLSNMLLVIHRPFPTFIVHLFHGMSC